jgi:hypothetical protein
VKSLIPTLLVVIGLPCLATAQRGGGARAGGMGGGFSPGGMSGGRPTFGVFRGAARGRGSALRGRRDFGQNGIGFWDAPLTGDEFGTGTGPESCIYNAEPGPIILPPAGPPAPPPFPERPATLVIQEYSWPGLPVSSATAFSIVLKNGDVLRAVAVWMQGDRLHYAGTGAAGGTLALDAIDIESTRKINAQAGLTWPSEAR